MKINFENAFKLLKKASAFQDEFDNPISLCLTSSMAEERFCILFDKNVKMHEFYKKDNQILITIAGSSIFLRDKDGEEIEIIPLFKLENLEVDILT